MSELIFGKIAVEWHIKTSETKWMTFDRFLSSVNAIKYIIPTNLVLLFGEILVFCCCILENYIYKRSNIILTKLDANSEIAIDCIDLGRSLERKEFCVRMVGQEGR